MSQMHGWPKTEESARKVFDALGPETVVKATIDARQVGEAIAAHLRDVGVSIKRGFAAQAEQHRRDRDDELDWLGEWGGRRR